MGKIKKELVAKPSFTAPKLRQTDSLNSAEVGGHLSYRVVPGWKVSSKAEDKGIKISCKMDHNQILLDALVNNLLLCIVFLQKDENRMNNLIDGTKRKSVCSRNFYWRLPL